VPVGATIAAAGTLGGAAIASSGARRQASAAQDTATQNNAQQLAIFNQQRADLAPWRASGTAALAEINRRLGLGGQTPVAPREGGGRPMIAGYSGGGASVGGRAPGVGGGYMEDSRDVGMQPRNQMADNAMMANLPEGGMPQNVLSMDGFTGPQVLPGIAGTAPTTIPPAPGGNALDPENRYGGFYASPGYQFRFDEGQRGINANRAASGMMQSGDTLRALTRYGQDYASNEYNTQLNQLFSVAGLGQTATGQGNALASQYGAQVGQNNQNASNALQSSYGTQANAWGNALGTVAGMAAFSTMGGGAAGGVPADLWGLF
jgi:hypothetical protein